MNIRNCFAWKTEQLSARVPGRAACYLPLGLCLVYLLATYLVYMIGSMIWPYARDLRTFLFMLGVLAVFPAGYMLVMIRRPGRGRAVNAFVVNPNPLVLICCIGAALLYVPYCYQLTGHPYPDVLRALVDVRAAYKASHSGAHNSFALSMLCSVLDPFRFALVPFTFMNWEKLRRSVKICALSLIGGYYLIYIAAGSNQPVFSVALMLMICFLARTLGGEYKGRENRSAFRGTALLTAALMTFSLLTFAGNMRSRMNIRDNQEEAAVQMAHEIALVPAGPKTNASPDGNHAVNSFFTTDLAISEEHKQAFHAVLDSLKNAAFADVRALSYLDMSDPIVGLLPQRFIGVYSIGLFYVANGYHGLSVALHQPFDWTYGVGFSTFLTRTVNRFAPDLPIFARSYPGKAAAEGWPVPAVWCTIYPYLASDLSWAGALLFMGLLGALLAIALRDVYTRANPFAILPVCHCAFIVLFSITVSDSTLGSPYFFFSFAGSLIIYAVSKLAARKTSSRKAAARA